MSGFNPEEPLDDQIITSTDEQNELGSADQFYDAGEDRIFTVEAIDDSITIRYFWPDETETIPTIEFTSRLASGRYGAVSRDVRANHRDILREFALAAFEDLFEGHDIEDTYDPLGMTFRELRYMLLINYGPEIREAE